MRPRAPVRSRARAPRRALGSVASLHEVHLEIEVQRTALRIRTLGDAHALARGDNHTQRLLERSNEDRLRARHLTERSSARTADLDLSVNGETAVAERVGLQVRADADVLVDEVRRGLRALAGRLARGDRRTPAHQHAQRVAGLTDDPVDLVLRSSGATRLADDESHFDVRRNAPRSRA